MERVCEVNAVQALIAAAAKPTTLPSCATGNRIENGGTPTPREEEWVVRPWDALVSFQRRFVRRLHGLLLSCLVQIN